MICAETFGCSGKVPYFETHRFAELTGLAALGNFSEIPRSGLIASIDRISRCTQNWGLFAAIAISHASRDIEVGLGIPSEALICFEFGADADAEDRTALAKAVHDVAAHRSIQLGKCHSAMTGSEVTSLVISLIGERFEPTSVLGPKGLVWINGPLGFAKLLYLEGLKQDANQRELAEMLAKPLDLIAFSSSLPVMSDVSGHGLAGCLCDLAQRHSLEIEVTLSHSIAAGDKVIETPLTLLENDLADYPIHTLTVANAAMPLAMLKETAGPIIGLSDELTASASAELRSSGWRLIGSFKSAAPRVAVGWTQ